MNFKVVFSVFAGLVLAGCANSDRMMHKGGMTGSGDGMHGMTLKQCQEHMAMKNKGGMKMDDDKMKMDTMCKDMMTRHGGPLPMGSK